MNVDCKIIIQLQMRLKNSFILLNIFTVDVIKISLECTILASLWVIHIHSYILIEYDLKTKNLIEYLM